MDVPTFLTDRYELTAHIARGGMADVYRGTDHLLGRQIAVKVLHSQFSSDEAFVKRFRREAQAAANLSHPNIVAIYDWGQYDSTYFIVMELIEGRSLRDVLRSEGALLPRRATEIAAEVAAALSVAHRAGLVHRDIKPGNILLATDGTVKVTDFGIARAWDDSQELTRTGAVIGTATYFSPEQAQGSPADERSDVYSLGVVLYEMLTGRPPFLGDSPVSVAFQHVSSEVAPPSAFNADVPAELDAVVLKAMHKDPAQRYQTAEELRTDLVRALSGDAPAAVGGNEAPTRVIQAPIPPATVPPDEVYRQLEEPPPSNLPFVVGTFALLATLGVLVFLVLRLLGGGGSADVQTIVMPDVTGSLEAEAFAELLDLGLRPVPAREASDTVEEGRVIRTDPAGGDTVDPGATVVVVVSAGSEEFTAPPLVGLTRDAAEQLIEAQGLVLGQVTLEPDSDEPPGTVIAMSPAPGTRVPAGTPIDLVVSSGPDLVTLEDLTGLTEREATSKLAQLGLSWEISERFSDEVEAGRVIETDPVADTQLEPGSVVTLVVSKGPEPVEVADLFGLTPEAAQTRVERDGLVLRVAVGTQQVTDPNLVGRVVAQFPAPGTLVDPGSIITVTLGEAAPETTTTTTAPTTTTSEATTTTSQPPTTGGG